MHRTVFVSTTRPEWEVRDWLRSTVDPREALTVRTPSVDDLLDDPPGAVEPIPPESLLVIDAANALETESRERYLAFLNAVKERLRDAHSVGLVHCLEADRPRRTGNSRSSGPTRSGNSGRSSDPGRSRPSC